MRCGRRHPAISAAVPFDGDAVGMPWARMVHGPSKYFYSSALRLRLTASVPTPNVGGHGPSLSIFSPFPRCDGRR
ncbi:MAG: hypothetical protein LBP65_02620 [Puniceicoccales bacterium]|nr:hypothetical protein [Puniceicoccales bacterium]